MAPPLSWTNCLDLAETETRTLPNRFRREIGVERSPKHFVRHAASVVRDDDFYHPSRRSWTGHTVLRRDYDLATMLQRCARFAAQIEEREVKVFWIRGKIGEILGNLGVKRPTRTDGVAQILRWCDKVPPGRNVRASILLKPISTQEFTNQNCTALY
jgi:hypothetical protein